uniref:HDC09969 n=1 Tax=Drosophila melanogaster TaxID=7227 RepID=Q6ILA1_DROME|nr:TPA_inf: HDC09969 [Drosophila melanogaster]
MGLSLAWFGILQMPFFRTSTLLHFELAEDRIGSDRLGCDPLMMGAVRHLNYTGRTSVGLGVIGYTCVSGGLCVRVLQNGLPNATKRALDSNINPTLTPFNPYLNQVKLHPPVNRAVGTFSPADNSTWLSSAQLGAIAECQPAQNCSRLDVKIHTILAGHKKM